LATFPKVRVVEGQATTAEVNAGKTIVDPIEGHTITVVDGWLRAIGGNAGGADTVVIEDTAGTDAFTMAVAGLTQNTVARVGLATHSTNTNVGTALGAGKGLKIAKAGAGALATATAIDYCVLYKIDG
jgi:hypothetical protein